jgi:hypothetical protein
MSELTKNLVLSFGRKAALLVAAYLIQKGVFTADQQSNIVEAVSGLILLLGSLGWSWWDQRKKAAANTKAAVLTSALATELAPLPTTQKADAIINQLVVDSAKSLPPNLPPAPMAPDPHGINAQIVKEIG